MADVPVPRLSFPSFTGSYNEEIQFHLQQFDALTALFNLDAGAFLPYLKGTLKGEALIWCTSRPENEAYAVFRQALIDRFSKTPEQLLFLLENRHQLPHESAQAYADSITHLMQRANIPEATQVFYFIRGLLPSIRADTAKARPGTLAQAVDYTKYLQSASPLFVSMSNSATPIPSTIHQNLQSQVQPPLQSTQVQSTQSPQGGAEFQKQLDDLAAQLRNLNIQFAASNYSNNNSHNVSIMFEDVYDEHEQVQTSIEDGSVDFAYPVIKQKASSSPEEQPPQKVRAVSSRRQQEPWNIVDDDLYVSFCEQSLAQNFQEQYEYLSDFDLDFKRLILSQSPDFDTHSETNNSLGSATCTNISSEPTNNLCVSFKLQADNQDDITSVLDVDAFEVKSVDRPETKFEELDHWPFDIEQLNLQEAESFLKRYELLSTFSSNEEMIRVASQLASLHVGREFAGTQYENELYALLLEFLHIFAWNFSDLGSCTLGKFDIEIENAQPVATNYYPLSEVAHNECPRQIKELFESNLFVTISSPFASPCFVVLKARKPGETLQWRMVIDYRRVNDITTPGRLTVAADG